MCDTLHSTPVSSQHVGHCRYKRLQTMLLAAMVFAAMGMACRVGAQAPSSPASGSATEKQVTALFYDLDDIDWLKSLTPLKLTPDELDKLIAAMSAAKDAYDKQWVELAMAQLKPISAEINDVKHKALKGGEVPDDFYMRAKKASAGFAEARNKLDLQTLALVAPVIHDILTPAQIMTAAKMSRSQAAQDGKPTAGTDTQWFNKYVQSVILGHPRIVALLKEMRAAADEGTSGKKAEVKPAGRPLQTAARSGTGY